ncbi:MAG: hypothetical protein WC046_08080 [Candidatus Bathyarchaeia archaeon]
MEACEVVKLLINKAIILTEHKRPEKPRYKQVKLHKALTYTKLKDQNNNTQTVKHLKKHSNVCRTLGLRKTSNRTTLSRWQRHYLFLPKETFEKIANILQLTTPTKITAIDSTPLVNLYDTKAQWVTQAKESSETSRFMLW